MSKLGRAGAEQAAGTTGLLDLFRKSRGEQLVAADHPVPLAFPEAEYLKGLVLEVE